MGRLDGQRGSRGTNVREIGPETNVVMRFNVARVVVVLFFTDRLSSSLSSAYHHEVSYCNTCPVHLDPSGAPANHVVALSHVSTSAVSVVVALKHCGLATMLPPYSTNGLPNSSAGHVRFLVHLYAPHVLTAASPRSDSDVEIVLHIFI